MCGRFTLRTPMNRLVERFLFECHDTSIAPRFNIAPSQPVAALRKASQNNRRQFSLLRWGLIPSWSKDRRIGNRLINARAETVAEKPSFRSAFERRRCLILSDGYYEWKKLESKSGKQPYYIRMLDDRPFAFAGLWETWHAQDGLPVETCTIITTAANDLTRPIHHRMPVIVDPNDYDGWLGMEPVDTSGFEAILRPFGSAAMTAFPVSTIVNSPRNDTAECIRRQADSSGDANGKNRLELL